MSSDQQLPPQPPLAPEFETKCVNTIRVLSADTVQAGNSGHPGAPMGCAPMAHTLFGKVMKFNPKNPKWANRDRFVLSNGHACALQYSMLNLAGFDLPIEQLMKFRQLNSLTPGHPENFLTAGVEVATGPLGQGISNAVGLAAAEAHMAAVFNRPGFPVVDHYTYVICGDGCLQEGVSAEASSLAGHLRLGKLIVLYDDNLITIDGHTDLSFSEDVLARYAAYGWHTATVADGNADFGAIHAAVEAAKAVTDRPSIIKIRTLIGFGSKIAGSHSVHGAPLGETDLAQVKARFGFDPAARFVVPEDVRSFYDRTAAGGAAEAAWTAMFDAYAAAHPALAAEFSRRSSGELPPDWRAALPRFRVGDAEKATRQWSSTVLNALAAAVPELLGGSADLTPSTLTQLTCSHDFQADSRDGRYFRFGVREHAMAAVCNGMAAYGGGLVPFCATFLNFIGYALGAVRLSALSRFRVLYIMTHDSIGLGEDGPTHQPVEMLAGLRAMPNLLVLRPADGNEVSGAYAAALSRPGVPSVLALSRQPLPVLAGSSVEAVELGAYTLCEHGEPAGPPALILASSGSEVHLCVAAAAAATAPGGPLAGAVVRVVSMPCWELFEAQSLEYRLSVFPPGAPVLGVEASGVEGWAKYSHAQLGLGRFGASGPIKQLYPYFGFTPANIIEQGRKVVEFYQPGGPAGGPAPSLLLRPIIDITPAHH